MFNLVIFGAPGSGKGTQSEKLIETYGLFHISTGEVLRDQIAKGTELGKTADKFISNGQLIPDELMVNILSDLLDSNPATRDGVIFDGFPRTIPQAVALNEMLAKRGVESGRSDDNLETIQKRLAVYHSQTQPLRDFYVNEGKYLSIKGSGSIDDIFADIKKSIDAIK